jgi:Na+/H+ antiporter NhaD/arsenite permease-like protein
LAPDLVALGLFAATYALVALGRLPGLKLDRTGFALLGAFAFLATGRISLEEAKASIDAPTLALLFGMMLLSAQYQLSGLYGAIAGRLTRVERPARLLAGTLLVSAALSAVLTNDVVCFALTPLVGSALLAARRDPLPYFLAIACGSNLGSALTPIGNPQNILIAQRMSLEFLPFVAACALPVAVSLACAWALLARRLGSGAAPPIPPPAGIEGPPLDRRQAVKAVALTALAIGLFLGPVPAYLTACLVAGIVLTSRRMQTRDMLALVDWHLLALFVGLFVVTRGLEVAGWTAAGAAALAAAGLDLAAPSVLVPVAAVAGSLIGNVPIVMLLLRFVPSEPELGHALALASTFAGNAVLVGSVANLIVAEQAARLGAPFGFREHLRVGLPVTLVSLAAAVAALAWSGWP